MRRFVVTAIVAVSLSGALWAGVAPAGSEFRINAHPSDDQVFPSVAMDGAGRFVVVWETYDQYGSGIGVFGRRFDGLGVPRGAEFKVNTYKAGNQHASSIAVDQDGEFVVVWTSDDQDGSGGGVFARRFDRAGAPQGPDFQVNAYTYDDQAFPSVAVDGTGNFVVVWTSDGQDGSSGGIFGRRLDSAGAPQGSEFQVNIYTAGKQFDPSVAADGAGNFVVIWASDGQDGSGWGVFGRRFDDTGAPQGSEFLVNTYTGNDQGASSVAMDAAGNFVVTWMSDRQDGSSFGVFGQRFDSAGVHDGSEFQVNTYTTSDQAYPSVALDAAGDFVVAWMSDGQDGSSGGIFGRHFDDAGAPLGSDFQINTYTTGEQFIPSVAADGTGNFVVAWTSYGQDGSSFGVFGQRFVGRHPEITDPLAGDTLDCSNPTAVRPTLAWDDDGYDAFRVFIGWDPSFGTGLRVTSGDTLLRATAWEPPAKKWRKACASAVAANPGSPVLYVKVFGVDRDLPKGDPARKMYSSVVKVNVQP